MNINEFFRGEKTTGIVLAVSWIKLKANISAVVIILQLHELPSLQIYDVKFRGKKTKKAKTTTKKNEKKTDKTLLIGRNLNNNCH